MPLDPGMDTAEIDAMLLELDEGSAGPLDNGILFAPMPFEDPTAACVEAGLAGAVVVTVTVAGDETEHDSVTVSVVDCVVV